MVRKKHETPKRASKKRGSLAKKATPRKCVTVGRDYVSVRYQSLGKEHTLDLSKKAILASGRAALAQVPVIID